MFILHYMKSTFQISTTPTICIRHGTTCTDSACIAAVPPGCNSRCTIINRLSDSRHQTQRLLLLLGAERCSLNCRLMLSTSSVSAFFFTCIFTLM
jgi:hypothetical protein